MKPYRYFKPIIGWFLGLAFFWLVVMKLIARITSFFGVSGPCPPLLSWTLDNRFRLKTVNKMLGSVGIRPGEPVLSRS
jgi:hypothetical protein